MKSVKRIFVLLFVGIVCYFCFNAIKIVRFSTNYSENKSDVPIVLGAGTQNGQISPVFRERLNHGIYLFDENIVDYILLTGGI